MRWRWLTRSLLLKIIPVAGLLIMLRPIPPLLLFSNPEEAVIFGRYTMTYFLVIVGYSFTSFGWLAVTIWLLKRANEERIANWREWLLGHCRIVFPLLSLAALTLGLLTGLFVHTIIVFPGSVQSAISLVPVGMLVCLWLMIGVVMHQPGERTVLFKGASLAALLAVLLPIPGMVADPVQAGPLSGRFAPAYVGVLAIWIVVGIGGSVASAWLLLWLDQTRQDAWQDWVEIRWSSHTPHDASIMVLAAALILLAVMALREGLFTQQIYKDATVHVYIGQALLRGEIPYRDVLYFHPPLRFAVSAVWSALAGLLSLPVVETARTVNLLFAMVLLWVIYRIGLNVTGQPIGGLGTMLVYLLLPLTGWMLVEIGPTLKVEATLLVAASIMTVQEKRWGWAGVLSAAAVLIWLPAGITTLGLGLAILLQDGEGRWRSAGRFIAAGLVTAGAAAGVLALAGVLDLMLQETIGAALTIATTASGSDGHGFFSVQYWPVLLEWAGYVPMIVLYGIGLWILIARERLRIFRKPPLSALLLGMAPLLLFMSQDLVGDGDFIIIKILLAALGGVGLCALLPLLWGDQRTTALLETAIGGTLLLAVVLVAVTPRADHLGLTLAEQKELSAVIDGHLAPAETVQSFDQLWYPVLSESDSLLPPVQIRPKGMVANRAAGWSQEIMVAELLAQEPALILILPDNLEQLNGALDGKYVQAGSWKVAERKQTFLVLRDRPDLQAAIQAWWQATGND